MLLIEKEKVQKDLNEARGELDGIKKRLEKAKARKVVADYALGDALVQLQLANEKLKTAEESSPDSARASISDAHAQTKKARASLENLTSLTRGDEDHIDPLVRLRALVSDLSAAQQATRDAVYDVLSRDFRRDPNLVTVLLESWPKQLDSEGAIYYIEVLLLDASPEVSRPKKEEIVKFVEAVQNRGGLIQHVGELIRRALDY
jgi:hypothetical protein